MTFAGSLRHEARPSAGGVIEFDQLDKTFYRGDVAVQALDKFSLEVRPREFLAIVGPSGCGKSTLLNLTAGLMFPTTGEVRYSGVAVRRINTRVGYITQRDNLVPWRTAEENIGLPLEIQHRSSSDRTRLVAGALDTVGLGGFARHYPGELSGGMRKRVTLARTLVYEPETLLMDEPFGALDAQLRLVLHQELLSLWQRSGTTIVFVTHDLAEAVSLADRVVVMTARPGRIKTIQEIDLPRPRDVANVRFTPRFAELHELLWDHLKADVARGESL